MKNLQDILEASILDKAGTLDNENNWFKNQKEIELIKKPLYLLNSIYNIVPYTGSTNNKKDSWGTKFELGDIVLYKKYGVMQIGIVISDVNEKNQYRIANNSNYNSNATSDDPYADTTWDWIDFSELHIIAKKKNAEKMLKLIEKII